MADWPPGSIHTVAWYKADRLCRIEAYDNLQYRDLSTALPIGGIRASSFGVIPAQRP